uniref:rRNA methyltransferase 2, mitochondrial n=1 Tax=Caenorhabditis tropicalis TaxID=1561998 RepID=A0A1I7V537_9PELO
MFKNSSKFRYFTTECKSFSTKRAKGNLNRYIQRQSTDEFAVKAREHNYRARSAFKLMEIDEKFKFLKPESTVIDIGCAPGSWLQVVVDKCPNGEVLGVDLQNVLPIRGATIFSLSDITSLEVQQKIREHLVNRSVDVVLSDMAPNPTGDNATDHLRLIELCRTVFLLFTVENAFKVNKNGVFLCKIWDGSARSEFVRELSDRFGSVKTVKPVACRDNSAELYLFCRNFK